MSELRRELAEKPPLTGSYKPEKGTNSENSGLFETTKYLLLTRNMIFAGDLCVARYSADNEWYRARVEKILPDGEVTVLFIDYGNRENVKGSRCARVPSIPAANAPAFAKEYALACISLPADVSLSLFQLQKDRLCV